MIDSDFEGSLILEKLAEIGMVDEFYGAIDSDDFDKIRSLLLSSNIDSSTVEKVIRKIIDSD